MFAAGAQNAGYLSSVVVFDPASNTWDQTKADMTTVRSSHALVVLDGELHAVGQSSSGAGHNTTTVVERYDAQTNSWGVVPEMKLPEGRDLCAYAARMI